MASDRDTLAELINPHQPKARGYWCSCGKALSEHIDQHRADVMLAAGWRPPARVIETAEQLDAMPPGSIVKHSPCRASGRAECVWAMEHSWWYGNTTLTPHRSRELLEIHCEDGETLTVLWEPEQEARQ